MRATDLWATADLVGRRNRISWSFELDAGESLADLPDLTLLRKERDFQFPPIDSEADSPYVVYSTSAFPSDDTTVSELPGEEWREGEFRYLRTVTSLSRSIESQSTEVFRLIETTLYDVTDRPNLRQVEVLDLGDSIGGLLPGTPYYYELIVPEDIVPVGKKLLTTATPGEAYGLAGRLYEMLPEVHRRHDTLLRAPTPGAEAVPEASPRGGQLRRMLDPFGTALDQMRSSAEWLLNVHDVDHVEHRFLPLMAEWTGWELSRRVPIPLQRHEVKFAPALYRVTGSVPSAHLWVRHAAGWRTRVKEFTHNVFETNQPEGLNVWLRVRDGAGEWSDELEPLLLEPTPVGRPSAVQLAAEGETLLFYHALRMNEWGIWSKVRSASGEWHASELVSDLERAAQEPSAVVDSEGAVWVFWSEYDRQQRTWSLRSRQRTGDDDWGEVEPFGDDAQRRSPFAAVDDDGEMWLFWLERDDRGWRLRYARREAGTWSAAVDFPDEGGERVRVQGQPAVVSFPTAAPSRRLWVFFTHTEPTGEPGQTRRVVIVRTKGNLVADASGWSPTSVVSQVPPTHHEEAPAAFVDAEGRLELFTSANRQLGWSLWRRRFDLAGGGWEAPERLPATLYSERHPWPVRVGNETHLFYRANRSPLTRSVHPGGIASVDFRYAGSVTTDTAHPDKIAQHGRFADFQSYTYDIGQDGERSDDNRYAHDTAGLFLAAETASDSETTTGRGRIRQVLRHFVPSSMRAVLIAESTLHVDYVYDYSRPHAAAPRRVEAVHEDEFEPVPEVSGLGDVQPFTDDLQ